MWEWLSAENASRVCHRADPAQSIPGSPFAAIKFGTL